MIPKFGCFFSWRIFLRFRSHGILNHQFKRQDKNSILVGRCFVIFSNHQTFANPRETVGAISRVFRLAPPPWSCWEWHAGHGFICTKKILGIPWMIFFQHAWKISSKIGGKYRIITNVWQIGTFMKFTFMIFVKQWEWAGRQDPRNAPQNYT